MDGAIVVEPGGDGGDGGDGKGGGKKRGPPMTKEEGMTKIKRTIGWYNHNGNLASPIHFKSIEGALGALKPREALKILNELEQKGSQLRDPTAWLKKAAENKGPELDVKVRRTIAWYNKWGNLQEQIKYDEVREALGWLSPGDACNILAGLEGKDIKKPTGWIVKAAWNKLNRDGPSWDAPPGASAGAVAVWTGSGSWTGGGGGCGGGGGGKGGSKGGGKGGGTGWSDDGSLDPKVKKTIGWYNRNGGLQGEIRFDEVAPVLAQVGAAQALKILAGLDPEKGEGSTVKNPTAWIKKAAENLMLV